MAISWKNKAFFHLASLRGIAQKLQSSSCATRTGENSIYNVKARAGNNSKKAPKIHEI